MNALMILQARAEARALLYSASEFDLEQATTPLYRYAVNSGIVNEFGMDTVINIVQAAFDGR